MAIHSRRPQDPPNLPKITIGSPPPDAVTGVDEAAPVAAAARPAVGRPDDATTTKGSAAATPQVASEGQARARKPKSAAPREGWFVALLLSVVPLVAVVLLPPSAMPELLGIAAVFIVSGVVMFVRGS